MKVQLSQIPEEGLRERLRLPLAGMTRLSEVIGAQEGEAAAELLVKNREGAVEITGHVQATLRPPCQRCLEPVPVELDEDLRVTMVSLAAYGEGPDEVHLGAGDLELSYYEGEEVDLAHVVEDELLLLIPEPVAEEDEDGRCVECGKLVDEMMAQEPEIREGHPFAAMKDLLTKK